MASGLLYTTDQGGCVFVWKRCGRWGTRAGVCAALAVLHGIPTSSLDGPIPLIFPLAYRAVRSSPALRGQTPT
jgi:hypothetical protein